LGDATIWCEGFRKRMESHIKGGLVRVGVGVDSKKFQEGVMLTPQKRLRESRPPLSFIDGSAWREEIRRAGWGFAWEVF